MVVGGRVFNCSFCDSFLCEDDQFEHQASCQKLESEKVKCASCNRLGQYSCLRCKICFCEDHVRRKGVKYTKGEPIQCPKCGYQTKETKDLSMSTRSYKFGKLSSLDDEDSSSEEYSGGYYGEYSGGHYEEYEEGEDEEDEDEEDEEGECEESEESNSDQDPNVVDVQNQFDKLSTQS